MPISEEQWKRLKPEFKEVLVANNDNETRLMIIKQMLDNEFGNPSRPPAQPNDAPPVRKGIKDNPIRPSYEPAPPPPRQT